MSDLAGTDYWDDVWTHEAKPAFNPAALENRSFVRVLDLFLRAVPENGVVMEAGCADSVVMPYIHGRGFRTIGLDYSEPGCAKFRAASPMSEAYCCDVFNPPAALAGSADAIYSLGLVEHFTDTAEVINALAGFLKPGGVMLTVVPNMHGTTGWLQKVLNRSAFDVHFALTPHDLQQAHRQLSVDACDYFSAAGYGVVNHGYKRAPRAVIGLLSRLSQLAVALDEKVVRLPRTRAFSPHCFCIARKAG